MLFLLEVVVSLGILFSLEAHAAPAQATLESHLVNADAAFSSIEFHLTVPVPEAKNTPEGFFTLDSVGLTPLHQAGRPNLAGTGALVSVPPNAEPVLTWQALNQVELKARIEPAQKRFRCECSQTDTFHFDADLYDSRSRFPLQTVSLEEAGTWAGVRLIRVVFNPMQMEMGTDTVEVTTELAARIDFKMSAPSPSPLRVPAARLELIRETTVNGASLTTDVVQAESFETLLIVAADALKEAVKPLAIWKQSKGLHVSLVSFSEAGGTKEALQAYIKKFNADHETSFAYLLLVGNQTSLPPFQEATQTGPTPTDYPYTLLTPHSLMPDLFYGRLAADNVEEVRAQISRWVEYEKSPDAESSWYNSGATIASKELGINGTPSDKQYAEQIQNFLKPAYRSVDAFLESDQSATVGNIINSVNQGRSWLTYIGHGDGASWQSVVDDFTVDKVQQANNATKLPFVIDAACLNADYTEVHNHLAHPLRIIPFATALGKQWVTLQKDGKNAGAVAYLGATQITTWDPPALMAVGIAKYHFTKPVYSLGASVLAGQLYLMEQMGVTGETKDNLKWFTLLGDPSLVLRTSAPKPYTVKTETLQDVEALSLAVTVQELSGQPATGLMAAIAVEGKDPLAMGLTDTTGNVVLKVNALTHWPSQSMITVTGVNRETYQRYLSQIAFPDR